MAQSSIIESPNRTWWYQVAAKDQTDLWRYVLMRMELWNFVGLGILPVVDIDIDATAEDARTACGGRCQREIKTSISCKRHRLERL